MGIIGKAYELQVVYRDILFYSDTHGAWLCFIY